MTAHKYSSELTINNFVYRGMEHKTDIGYYREADSNELQVRRIQHERALSWPVFYLILCFDKLARLLQRVKR